MDSETQQQLTHMDLLSSLTLYWSREAAVTAGIFGLFVKRISHKSPINFRV